MKNSIKIMMTLIAVTLLTACGAESDDIQREDSEANDQDNIVQRVEPGTVVGSLSNGVDMNDFYLVYADGGEVTRVSVTNESGMDLVLSEVSIFNQVEQQSNRNGTNEAGNEVESFQSTSSNYYSTYIRVSVLEGSGEYTLTIDVSPAE